MLRSGYLDQIQSGIEHNLYYLSLFTSLAIPDMCGALITPSGKSSPCEYMKWFDSNVAKPKEYQLTGENCYNFRCSMLHQGTTQYGKGSFSRILFVEPQTTSNIFHNNIIGDALNIDVKRFCNDIIEVASKWFNQIQDDNNFQKNYDKFIRRYANGLPPYISGVPKNHIA